MLIIRTFLCFLFLIICASALTKANTEKIDSLKNLARLEQNDTIRINLLISIADDYRNLNIDSAIYYYQKAEISTRSIINAYVDKSIYSALKEKQIAINSGIGAAYRTKGNNNLALEFFEKSLEIAEEINYKQGIAASKYNIGVVYYNQGQLETAMDYYKKALLLQEEVGYKLGAAITFNAIGAIFVQRGMPDDAIEYYTKSLEINEEVENLSGVATLLNNIGQIYDNKGDSFKALEYYYKSIELRKEIGDKLGMATSLNNIGNIYRSQGDIPKSLEYFISGLKIREEVGDRNGMAVSLNNIGNIYRLQDDHEKALEYYENSMAIYREVNNVSGMASSLNNMGVLFRIKADSAKAKGEKALSDSLFSRALENYFQAYELRGKIGERRSMAISLNNIGAIYLELANEAKADNDISNSNALYKKALDYYTSSYELCVETGSRQGMSFTLTNIARVHFYLDNISSSRKYAIEAYKVSKSLGFPDNIMRAAQLLKEIYVRQRDFEKAFEFFTEEVLMRDSINNEANFRETMRQQAKYEFEKKALADSIKMTEEINISEAKLLAKEEQLKRVATQRYALIGGIIILFTLGTIVYYHYRQKRNANILLASQNAEINQKNEEITSQRDEIESQRDLVVKQKLFIEEQNKAITDSINYAKRIQQSLLPDLSIILNSNEYENNISDSFIFYRPKEIVSGDFYWANRINDHLVIAVADCTGHGVPGGFMSMLGISFLNEIVNNRENLVANEILNDLRDSVISTLKQAGRKDENNDPILDGINIIIAVLDLRDLSMQYAGSYNPLYMIRNKELSILKTDRKTIGIFIKRLDSFTNFEIKMEKGDMFYMFSDGYIDQFDAKSNERYKYSRFKDLLMSINEKPLTEQKEILEATFDSWKGTTDQIDDVTILGFRV